MLELPLHIAKSEYIDSYVDPETGVVEHNVTNKFIYYDIRDDKPIIEIWNIGHIIVHGEPRIAAMCMVDMIQERRHMRMMPISKQQIKEAVSFIKKRHLDFGIFKIKENTLQDIQTTDENIINFLGRVNRMLGMLEG